MEEQEQKEKEEEKKTEGQEVKQETKEEKKPEAPGHGKFVLHTRPVEDNTGIPGLGMDYNCGLRVKIPAGDNWRVRAVDQETDYVVDGGTVPGGNVVQTNKTYFIPWRVEVYRGEEKVYEHAYDAKGKDVVIEICSSAMGDTLAFIPYAKVFKEKHGCRKLYVRCEKFMEELLAPDYPELEFIPRGTYPDGIYATYYVGNFFPSSDRNKQPYSWHITGLQGCAYSILGLESREIPPNLKPTKKEREIKEPYVCIAAQASAQCKYWNNPRGWMETIQFLKEAGYRVLCIDKDRFNGNGDVKNMIPWGSEDFTGNIPLQERVNLLSHADFYIGLGSGLSWLAWGTGVPVVLISGFSSPHAEFQTPYRVINLNVCTSCFNDGQHDFDMHRFDSCPRHQDDPKERFQCTKAINPGQVIRTIQRLMKDYNLDPKAGKMRKGT